MGQAPAVVLQYMTDADWSTWAGYAGYLVSCLQSTPLLSSMIPDVGIPMTATTDSSSTQAYQDIANGVHDGELNAVFQVYKDAGYSLIYIRPAWEYNGGWFRWVVNSSNVGIFNQAFQHITTLAHSFSGMTIKVIWNPGGEPGGVIKALTTYPGDSALDIIGIDSYGQASSTETNQAPLMPAPDYTILSASQLAVAHGKPFSIDEMGDAQDVGDTQVFTANVLQAIQSVPGVVIDHVVIWNDPSGGNGNLQWGTGDPALATAWRSLFAGILATQ
jgi:beta-mannanase